MTSGLPIEYLEFSIGASIILVMMGVMIFAGPNDLNPWSSVQTRPISIGMLIAGVTVPIVTSIVNVWLQRQLRTGLRPVRKDDSSESE